MRERTRSSWRSMIYRCKNPRAVYYYGRGLRVCSRWKKFSNFVTDMGDRPAGMTLDRIDNNKGYSPDNCRWATRKTQQQNTRYADFLTVGGVTLCQADWGRRVGIPQGTISKRLTRGWSVERAIMTPPWGKIKRPITLNRKTMSLEAWSRELKIGATTIAWRLENGWSVEKALGRRPQIKKKGSR